MLQALGLSSGVATFVSCMIVERAHCSVLASVTKTLISAIICHEDAKPVYRILDPTSCCYRVQHNIRWFATRRDDDIDGGKLHVSRLDLGAPNILPKPNTPEDVETGLNDAAHAQEQRRLPCAVRTLPKL